MPRTGRARKPCACPCAAAPHPLWPAHPSAGNASVQLS